MFQQTFAIIRNTFFESIRQPFMLVMLMVATLLIIFANVLAGYTMTDDQKMFIDMGMATVFICGAILAAFIATSVLGREIENRTALTVISKPVSRPVFVIGKYLGVAGGLGVATLFMCLVFLLVEQHTVLQTVRDPFHLPVITFGFGAAFIGLGVGIWCNYFYNKVFSSTVICVTTPLLALAYLFSLMFKADFTPQPLALAIKPQLWLGLFSMLVAVMVLTAIAVAASTRLGQVLTLCVTVGFFMTGLLSDWFFGRQIEKHRQDWSQRIRASTQEELAALLTPDDVPEVRSWILRTRTDEAIHRSTIWPCAIMGEIYKLRSERRSLTAADLTALEETKTRESRAAADEKLTSAVGAAQDAAAAVEWPIQKSQVVLEVDWPTTIYGSSGECEVVPGKRTEVFEPLMSRVAGTSERVTVAMYRVGYSIVPNFQVLWLSDALTQGHVVPLGYVLRTTIYGLLYIIAALGVAVMLFQRREVG